MDKERIKAFLKDHENKLLLLLITFAVLIRLHYFFAVNSQPIWWDEGDYLVLAKGLILNWQGQEWWSHFSGIRPLLIPLAWAFFFKLNLSELIIRFFTLLIPSAASVYLIYAIGRDLYNKKVGLIAGLMLSVYWVHMFYTFRLLSDIPAMFLGLLSIYFFWSWYIKKKKDLGLYLAMFFGVLGFSVRFPLALVPVSYPIYLFVTKKLSLLKDKIFWKSIAIGFASLVIYFVIAEFFGSGIRKALEFYVGPTAVAGQTSTWVLFKTVITMIPSLLEIVWFVTLIIGLFTLINLILGFDLFLKRKEERFDADFFVLLWFVLTLAFYSWQGPATDRWLLMIIPPLFFISAKGILLVYEEIKKYNKEIAILVLSILLLGGVYQHVTHTNSLIEMKRTSYQEEKLAGEFIKAQFGDGAKIITASVVQIAYYSNGYTYEFYGEEKPAECFDMYGNLNTSEYCQNITEKSFNEKIKKLNPDYMVVHIFEPVFTPQWAYTYAERHKDILEPVKVYSDTSNQPLLIVYKFKK